MRKTWPLALSGLLVGAVGAPAAITLINNHASPYRIVVASNAIPAERYAAEELQRYLETMSGVKLPIVTDDQRAQGREILLGDNAHLRARRAKVDFGQLGADGFVLRTDGNRLIVAGGKPRGTLYGVDALLEERLGVRWFTPEVESVPKREKVVLPIFVSSETYLSLDDIVSAVTPSEAMMEAFCRQVGFECNKIAVSADKSPDYESEDIRRQGNL